MYNFRVSPNFKITAVACGLKLHCIWRLMWSACHKKSYLTNLEVRNLKSEISCLCPVWLSQFCLFWKKWGKVSWIFQNSSIRHITNTFSYDMPTTFVNNITYRLPIIYLKKGIFRENNKYFACFLQIY